MKKSGQRAIAAVGAIAAGLLWMRGQESAHAVQSAREAMALTGVVRSDGEGVMEGVLVSARALTPLSPTRITVVTGKDGRYSFPRGTLRPGKYSLSVRAVGYDLVDPGAVAVTADAELNLRLQPAKNLAAQLTNAEWRLSLPGTEQQKSRIECVDCHTLQRVVQSTHGTKEWLDVLHRMSTYAPPSGAFAMPAGGLVLPYDQGPRNDETRKPVAEYLSSVNRSKGGEVGYTLKTLARLTGRSTRAIMTEYDLPRRDAQPHDAVVDGAGMVWYVDFAQPYIGVLNPRTGDVKEYKVDIVKGPPFPPGLLDIEIDKDGTPWVSMLFQGAIGRFDRKTEKLQIFSIPAKYNNSRSRAGMIAVPRADSPDQRIWFCDNTNRRMFRLDPATGQIDAFEAYPDELGQTSEEYTLGGLRQQRSNHSIYGIAVDSQGNGWFADMAGNNLGKIDAKTGKSILYPVPGPDTGPRRFWIDPQDRVWFAEYRRGGLGMFDSKSEQFKHWDVPTPYTKAYDVVVDKNGEVWGAGMWTDRVFRFDPKTETMTEYLLPSPTNTRRVDVDNSGERVAFWTGSNHGARLVKLEPLD